MWKFFTNSGAEKRTPALIVNPVARVITATPAVVNGVWTYLTFVTKDIDTDGMVDLAGHPTRITIQHAGKYQLIATTTWATNAAGGRGVRFVKNGVSVYDGSGYEGGSAEGFGPSSSAVIDCLAGDYLEVQVYQSSGGSINQGVCTLSITKIDGAVVSYVSVPGNFVGQEVAYAELIANLLINVTTEVTSLPIITAPSFTADGITPYMVDFFLPEVLLVPTAGAGIVFTLWDNGVNLGRLGVSQNVAATTKDEPLKMSRRLTPSAGAHVYSARGFSFGGSNSSVQAGAGGVGLDLPGFLRVTRAA